MLAIGDYMSVQCHACIGGTSIGEDIRKLDHGQHIISGTPGRVFGKYYVLYSSFINDFIKKIGFVLKIEIKP